MPERSITRGMTVEAVLQQDEELIAVFSSFGFKELTNPVMRKIMAGKVTIENACSRKGVDLETFLEALNANKKSP